MSDEITLSVDVPPVEVVPYRIEVRCGKTTVDVAEHGSPARSGNWTAWFAQGHAIPAHKGPVKKTLDQALDDARVYVQQQERGRLLRLQLAAKLSDGGGENGE